MQLSTFQDGFSAALLGPPADAPWLSALESQPGFAVYRNTVLKGCIDALQANYPTVCQLLIRRELFMRPHRRHACHQSTS